MSEQLHVLVEGRQVAQIRSGKGGRLGLDYDPDWRDSPAGYSLSASLPYAQAAHTQQRVLPYLWNLLPENPAVLQRWGQQYKVSPANPFKLLAHVGADVPGAVQLVPSGRLEEIQAAPPFCVDWLTASELAGRLQQLRQDAAAVRLPADRGRISLPGAQAKTALYYDARVQRWGVPAGRTPTTHIIKPCVPGLDGLVENEHFCQDLASRLQLMAARTSVLQIDEPYIVVERYDRLPPDSQGEPVRRIHQEDLCQALGLMPQRKYQEDGGPSIAQLVDLLRQVRVPEADVDRFLRANIFNWLIGGTDAHAKNYSLLITAGDRVRLAPLYDLSSQIPYPGQVAQRLAMKIGEHYEIARISAADWRKLAKGCSLDEDHLLTSIESMARVLPEHISSARTQAIKDGLSRTIIDPLAQQLTAHAAAACRRIGLPVPSTPARRRRNKGP
jgi:serine/threonine-protein kinase HipA